MSQPCVVKTLFLWLLPIMACGVTPAPPRSMLTVIDDNMELGLWFDTSHERRYIVEVSPDLQSWEEHYLSPFKDQGEGLKVRQVGEYAPLSEYYRLAVLPWRFQSLDASGDWIGDVSMGLMPDGRTAFVYQNRNRNKLYYCEAPGDGGTPEPEGILGTHAEDEPGFWDNNGYTDVTLQVSAAGIPHVVCRDHVVNEVILLWRPAGSPVWERRLIRSGLLRPFWAFPKFAISPQGVLGVVYAGDDGSYFARASIATPDVWEHRKITSSLPNNAMQTGIVFNDAGDAIAQAGGGFRIDAMTQEVTPLWISGQVQCRRAADGSLLTLDRGFDGTSIQRSADGGETWSAAYAARQNIGDSGAVSVDCDLEGRISLSRPPAVYRQITAGGAWKRTAMRGGAVHLTQPEGKIRMVIVEYDGELSLITED
jgi:hypothetical protein